MAAEFLEHAAEEQEHADRLAQRIVQLGGEPDFNPDTLTTVLPGIARWDATKAHGRGAAHRRGRTGGAQA